MDLMHLQHCVVSRCKNEKGALHHAFCDAHWARLPAPLKRRLWRAENERISKLKERHVLKAASACLDWLSENPEPQPNLVRLA